MNKTKLLKIMEITIIILELCFVAYTTISVNMYLGILTGILFLLTLLLYDAYNVHDALIYMLENGNRKKQS